MGTVVYNGKVISDQIIKDVLDRISDYFVATVNVTSGDRSTVPEGGSDKSLHLKSRAADFHVEGVDDGVAYGNMKNLGHNWTFITGHRYEFIWHGEHTKTGGPHLHLGRYGKSLIGYANCMQEGITPEGKGKYPLDAKVPILPIPGFLG